ncbi:major facilitator transporter [Novosphingobium nitrogenifigens DSM 19370]|uniref:Lysosomal dipeptide transporter MFSD1 n=1 Tax=Novosphingobium nitrogenifigens DSM 19370 TaxID=983920 RepID=F1Z4A6_9SPHN|nr:MFS transporter [Novosphingobium nitrogenifigens]EGD60516.1 major facilitator transporter [Novosphingobium nitrogenifigens DSM 19370]
MAEAGVYDAGLTFTPDLPATPLRWLALVAAALAIFSVYYETDVIGEIADLLIRQRGFSQADIGSLNAAIYWPNVVLALVGGVLIDRFGPSRIALWTAALGVFGATLTAIGEPYALMWCGRLIFGITEGAIFMALVAGLAQWFPRNGIALATGLFLSLARVGSFLCNTSSTWARPLYDAGWQWPLWLGVGVSALGFVAALVFQLIEPGRPLPPASFDAGDMLSAARGLDRLRFDRSFWTILGLHVLYAAVFFPFRQTYAVEYFQHAKHLSLQAAGQVNSGVFAAAIFATPLFGVIADRFGNRAMMLVFGTLLLPLTLAILAFTGLSPWLSTVLMGISWGLVPAVIWPATTMIVPRERLGTALGLITLIQSLGIALSNMIAGHLADWAGAGPGHPHGYDAVLGFFGCVSLLALACVVLLWRHETGPNGHGLERPGPQG